MVRRTFLEGLAAAAWLGPGAQAGSAPTAPPAGSEPSGLDCRKNPILPYDKKLEITDSVLDGPDFRLSNYRGFAVWVNIFATWCGPCREEQPLVVAAAATYYDRGLRTFGVFSDETDDTVRAYRKRYAITYPLVRDASGILTRNLQGRGNQTSFPAHLFITGDGRLSCYQVGGLDRDAIASTIESLLATVADPLPADPPAPKPR